MLLGLTSGGSEGDELDEPMVSSCGGSCFAPMKLVLEVLGMLEMLEQGRRDYLAGIWQMQPDPALWTEHQKSNGT